MTAAQNAVLKAKSTGQAKFHTPPLRNPRLENVRLKKSGAKCRVRK